MLQPHSHFQKAVFLPTIKSIAPSQPVSDYFDFRDAIDRNHAISEGFLVDVSSLAEHLFQVPVVFTRKVWELCVAMHWQDAFNQQWRVRSILCQARVAAKHAAPDLTKTWFDVKPYPRKALNHDRIRLWLVVETEQNKPVLTIMTHGEYCSLEVLS